MRSLGLGVICTLLLCLVLPAPEAQALPRMSLTSGTPCSTCHVNKQGGEMRTDIGWGSSLYMGMWDYEDLGVDFLADMYSNEIVERRVAVGIDARFQMARFGRPQNTLNDDGELEVVVPGRRVIPMQVQPHVAIEVLDYLRLHGSYAAGAGTFRGDFCDTPYAGQSCYTAQAIIDPSPSWPTLRVGMFQPSMGIRHDDHTMLLRHDVSRPRGDMIPPNYAELGLEATYQPRYWLRLDAGGFRAANLSESLGNDDVVSRNDVAYLGRMSFLPRFTLGDFDLYGIFGGSVYGAGRYRMENVFVGVGFLERASLMLEGARFTNGSEAARDGLNLSTILSIEAREWLVFEGRLERGTADVAGESFETRAAVAGIQFYPIPYVKLRPEYRYVRTNDYAMGQYTAQLHLFF